VTHAESLRGTATTLQTEILARRYYDCFNQREFEAGERYVHPQAVFTYPESPQQFIGRAGYRELCRRWASAFPDGSFSVMEVRVEGDAVRTVWVLHGTHMGLLSLPGMKPVHPTHIHTHVALRETIRVVEGQIVESTMEFDPHDLERRLTQ
jgi:predicted ester cyclase